MSDPFVDSTEDPEMRMLQAMQAMEAMAAAAVEGVLRRPPFRGKFRTFSPAVLGAGAGSGTGTRQAAAARVEGGDKGILPDSVLRHIQGVGSDGGSFRSTRSASGAAIPVLTFRVRNPKTNATCHAGVLEFDSMQDDERAYLPFWMLQSLGAGEGDVLEFSQLEAPLPKATSVKLMPLSSEFYSVKNPKAILEAILSRFTVLSKGLTFVVPDPTSSSSSSSPLSFSVVETAPSDAVCIVDTDVAVDFAPPPPGIGPTPVAPPGQQAPPEGTSDPASTAATPATAQQAPGFVPFSGTAHKQTDLTTSTEGTVECRNCGKRIPSASIEMHKMRCERLNARCALCSKVVAKTDLQKHAQDEHAPAECPACKKTVERRELETHMKVSCTAALVPCSYCEVPVKKSELSAHERYCGARTDSCPTCKKTLKKQDMLRHLSSGCKWPSERRTPEILRKDLQESIMICPRCNGVFTDLELLVAHVDSCSGSLHQAPMPRAPSPRSAEDRLVWCPQCHTVAVNGDEALAAHLVVCTGLTGLERPRPAPHIAIVPPDDRDGGFTVVDGPAKCPICGKVFPDGATASVHVNVTH